ncbi:MAG: hypothetical protein GXP63_04805 [DPANN group archaeon]|nr:hypothetical protein [DPANN group archaeon]
MAARYKRKQEQAKLAKEAIRHLFVEAEKASVRDDVLASKHVKEARKTAMRFRISLTSGQKRSFCKNCGHFLRQGKNVRVRMTQHHLVFTCLDCGHVQRFGRGAKKDDGVVSSP